MKRNLGQIQTSELKQLQRLILSPQMQQALHLLQLPVLELSTVIAEELEQNPLLEYEEGETSLFPEDLRETAPGKMREEEDLKSFVENSLAKEVSLFDSLMEQAKETFPIEKDLFLAELIIGNLDEKGLLEASLEEISLFYDVSFEELNKVLEKIQTFDPPGIAARSVRESFLIQLKLKGKEDALPYRIIDCHFEDLLHNRIPLIAKELKCSVKQIQKELKEEISHLDFRPGNHKSHNSSPFNSQMIIPDVYIRENEQGLSIEVNDRNIPTLRINWSYLNLLKEHSLSEEERAYIEEKITSGRSLMKNLFERHQTLYRIAEEIVEKQAPFFSSFNGKLIPLTMKEIAGSLGLHESTVVRAVANKYLSCSRGIFPLRSFFTHAYVTETGENVSSVTVKDLLQEIIKKEKSTSPYSDEELSSLINAKGIPCARRTIAKYRKELGIGTASQRRSHSD